MSVQLVYPGLQGVVHTDKRQVVCCHRHVGVLHMHLIHEPRPKLFNGLDDLIAALRENSHFINRCVHITNLLKLFYRLNIRPS